MVDHRPWFLFTHNDEAHGLPTSNAALVEDLSRSGSLRTPACTAAFTAIDRQHFWPAENGELAYADMPLRNGKLHLSAPHIYAKALESLMPLVPGMSFLNVGSGTGYFNSIVSELIGDQATNHGIDIWPETVAHAVQRCKILGKSSIMFTVGNIYQLNIHSTMRYDRIYLGACANSRSKYLYRLLEVGGILIGPFQVGHMQQLRRVVRQTETQFHVEILGSVQFASLVEPAPIFPPAAQLPRPASAAPSRSTSFSVESAVHQPIGLPHVPFTFSLNERPWTPERCRFYPASYRQVVRMGVLCRPRDQRLPCLPTELWVKHVFPWCSRWWFEVAPSVPHEELPGTKLDDDAELLDDGLSTRAPSSSPSAAPSAQTTPESGPACPPPEMAAAVGAMAAMEPEIPSGVLFEVHSNGQRHAIGIDEDPDDVEFDDGHRMEVPLRVLQLLAADARRLRRTRDAMEQEEDEDIEEEVEEEGDPMHAELADHEDASDQDADMLNPDENELDFDQEIDASDVGML